VLVPEKSKAIGPQVLDHLRQVRLQILSIRFERYVVRFDVATMGTESYHGPKPAS
jgi:hypothetical protein